MRTTMAVARKAAVPVEAAWAAVSRIGRLDVWFPSIATCRVDGDGVGALRYMTLARGGSIVDRVDGIDHARRRLVYDRIESPFPVSSYVGTVEVLESFDGRAVVVWTVNFVSAPQDSDRVKAQLEAGIGAGVEGLCADLERPGTG